MEKAADIVYCTENLFCPRTPSKNIGWFYNARYFLIRATTCPLPGVPSSFPIFGRKSLLDTVYIIAGALIALILCATGGDEGSGSIAEIGMIVAILLGLRNSLFTMMLSVSFERALSIHKIIGALALVLGLIHGIICLGEGGGQWLTGWILWGIMVGTACAYILKQVLFEYFYVAHIVLYIITIPFAAIHGAPVVAIIAVFWVIDLIIRYIITMHTIEAKVELLAGNVVRIIIPKNIFVYSPGQYCFLMIPALSSFEFHPFTISSAPHEEHIYFHIRSLGNWTRKLEAYVDKELAVLKAADEKAMQMSLKVLVEGPYGIPSIDLESPVYEVFLLIGGGIGVTPTQSIFCHLFNQHLKKTRKLARVLFIWSVKDKAMVSLMEVGMTWEKSHSLPLKPQARVYQTMQCQPSSGSKFKEAANLPLSFQPNLIPATSVSQWPKVRPISGKGSITGDEVREIPSKAEQLDEEVAIPSKNDQNNIFQCEFYLTSIRNEEDFKKANIDPVTQPYVKFGRPDLKKIFSDVESFCKENGHKRVATVVCGPTPMVNDVTSLSNKCRRDVSFDLHHEVFDF